MPSPIDELYKEIFGIDPGKSGAAFERLAAIATYLMSEGDVVHDDKLRGQFSNTLYQLDIHNKLANGSVMGEAKDFSERAKKVGRADLQKLGGALPDLKDINSGLFFSATNYTGPARKYAKSAQKIVGKPIQLWELRPGTEEDENGFIKTIYIQILINSPDHQGLKMTAHFTKEGELSLKKFLNTNKGNVSHVENVTEFFDENGNTKTTLYNLTSLGFGASNLETGKSHGCYWLKNHYMKINESLFEIKGIEYEVPYKTEKVELRITDDSGHRFVLVDEDGNVSRFLTDDVLKQFKFDEDGRVIRS